MFAARNRVRTMTLRPIEIDTSDAGLPITLANAKAAVKIDHAFEDTTLKRKLWTSIETVEKETGRIMRPGLYAMTVDAWPCNGEITLEAFPVRSVESMTYLPAAAGGPVTVSPASYYLEPTSAGAKVYFAEGFEGPELREGRRGAIEITFEAGYALESEALDDPALRLPSRLEEAALSMFGHLTKNREGVGDPLAVIPYSLELLIQSLKIFR
jgi:uncharacterized phiE125 gp8 family phage protein